MAPDQHPGALREQNPSVHGLIQWARGMCTDELPHHEIDAMLGQAVDAAKDVEEDRDRLRRRLGHTEQWYAVRWERLADELRGTEVWERVACITANGTAEVGEPPTYAQQMNVLRHERDLAVLTLAAHTPADTQTPANAATPTKGDAA